MRSDDDFREGSEKAARKESEVPPFVKGRRLHPSSSPLLPLGSRARAGLGGLGGASDSHRHAPWGAVRPWVWNWFCLGFGAAPAATSRTFIDSDSGGGACLLSLYSVCVQPLIHPGLNMQGPEGEGLLQGLWAGRAALGGSGEVPLPQAILLDLHTHTGICFSFGERLCCAHQLGSPGVCRASWEGRCAAPQWDEGAAPRGTSSPSGDTSIKTDRQVNEVEVVVPVAS